MFDTYMTGEGGVELFPGCQSRVAPSAAGIAQASRGFSEAGLHKNVATGPCLATARRRLRASAGAVDDIDLQLLEFGDAPGSSSSAERRFSTRGYRTRSNPPPRCRLRANARAGAQTNARQSRAGFRG